MHALSLIISRPYPAFHHHQCMELCS